MKLNFLKIFQWKRRNHTLAIIGNGFDRAHGYNTDYLSFVSATSSPSLDVFKAYCDDHHGITTWHSFEDNINLLTDKFLQESHAEDYDYFAVQKKIDNLNDIFQDIHALLIQYLRTEIKRKPVKKLSSVKRYLNHKAKVITFNYTNVAEAYTKNVFHAHGSLKENDILLGYDYRGEPCLASYRDMCWGKIICREALAFRRYLRDELRVDPNSSRYTELTSDFKKYQSYANSGRGIDDEVAAAIPNFDLIDQFIHRYQRSGAIPQFDYSKFKTIVVLGHGIEADRVFLSTILEKCTSVEEIIIFRYNGEEDASVNTKADFFKPYCNNIRSIQY